MRSPSVMRYLLLFILMNLMQSISSISQDSVSQHQSVDSITAADSTQAAYEKRQDDGDFDLFLLLFGIAAVCFMLGFVFLGLVAGFILIVIFIALLTTGILSVSVISGWYKKSVIKGIKTLFVLLGMLGGITCGILGFGLVSLLFKLDLAQRTIAMAGSIAGAIAGVALSLILFKMLMMALKYIKRKFKVEPTNVS